jgi:cell division protein FtsZ
MINLRMQTPEVQRLSPKITVVGVGGAGGNAVNNMIASGLEGCEFFVTNTDAQALEGSLCENRMQLGVHVTGGMGAGAKPEMGAKAAEESLEEVMEVLTGSNMVFITAGMGGGTGTGAAPVIARACRDAGILTVGVVTKPFHFEGSHRMRQAEAGISQMQDHVDTLIVIPNQNLFRVANERTTFAEAFRMADSVLQSGVRGVTDLITKEGLINLDFADIRSAMMEMGKAMMGTGEAEGERRALEAAEAAINNPLLDDVSMKGARGVIVNVTGSDLTLFEIDEACNRIRDEVDPNANIIFGSTFDDKLEGRMRVSVVATGIDAAEMRGTNANNGGVRVTAVGKPAQPAEATKPVFERARPVAQQTVAPAVATSPLQSAGPVPSQPGTAVRSPLNLRASAPITAPASRFDEPERDMFEQQEFTASVSPMMAPAPEQPYAQPQQQQMPVAQAQASGMRGTLHDGHFIPPKPITPEPQDTMNSSYGSYGSAQQTQGYNLRPPVPGGSREMAQQQAERKKTPSLFERITNGVRRYGDAAREDEMDLASDTDGEVQSSGGFSGLRAAPRVSEAPAVQGSLNIDSPASARKSADDLDIPAFLRRQAN